MGSMGRQFEPNKTVMWGLSILFLIGIGIIWYAIGGQLWNSGAPTADQNATEEETTTISYAIDCDYQRVLDGVCVDSAEDENPQVVTVMIENHPNSRPQSGLHKASIVYEAPVEANYSRFMAVYPADLGIDKVGSVRSARSYYLDWASEYGTPLYMHVGGSPQSLIDISDYGMNDLNEFYNGQYYWRAEDRWPPHNVYTNSELWNKALDNNASSYTETEYESWKFTGKEPCSGEQCVSEIKVSFLPPTYEAIWKYDEESGQFWRYQMGKPHRNREGAARIVADTIIIQRVNTEVLDDEGRLGMETIGQGEAIIFRDGHVTIANWKKESRTSRTRWFDDEGKPIGLKPGKIWVEIVNQTSSAEWFYSEQ